MLPTVTPRYPYEDICRRVVEAMRATGRPAKAVYTELGFGPFLWSKKIRGAGSTFSIGELGQIAEYFSAPRGWPFVDWDAASATERAEHLVGELNATIQNARQLGTSAPERPASTAGPGVPRSPSQASPATAAPGRRRTGGGVL